MSWFGRVLTLWPLRRRRALPALPAPPRAEPAGPAQPPPDGVTLPRPEEPPPDVVILPGPEEPPPDGVTLPGPEGPPLRLRPPPDPAQRARYFGAALLATMRTPRLPAPASVTGEPPLPLRGLATGTQHPSHPGRIARVEPIRFSLFVLWPEHELPEDAVRLWLTEPELLRQALAIRDAVLTNAAAGNAPLQPATLFDLALRQAPHAGTALLLCHVVTKAFARGGEAVTWRAADRRRGSFSDGKRLHQPLKATPDPDLPVFYALFAASSLGIADTGDWYRFFALAALALLTASGGCLPAAPIAEGPALALARRVDRAATELRDPALPDSVAYRGWRWANALNFAEYALWGRSDPRTREAARSGLGATIFGLRMAGAEPDPAWRWAVPRAGGWRDAPAEAPPPVAGLLAAADGLAA